MFNANEEEVAKREEERLLKSMAHKKGGALGGATAADIEKKKKEAERKLKEAAASSEAEKKAAEAKKHAQAEAERKRHQEAEAERKRQQDAAHTKSEEEKARLQASVEAARKEREEEDKKHAEELASITDSAESLKREEERVRRLMGQTVLDDSSPAVKAEREKRAALEKAQKEIEHQNAPAEQQRLVVQREEDRMARTFGVAATEEKQLLTPFTGCGGGEGEMGNIATGTVNTVVGGTIQAVPPGPPTTMSPFEMEVWSELNKVRMNPKGYAKNLELLEPYFAGFDFNIPGTSLKRPTKEGKRGLQEAIAFLKNQAIPGPVMKIDAHFSKSAADLCADHGPRGDVGTKLSDGTEPSLRLLRYGKWQKKCAETISYGAYNARDVVHQWLIDDGNHERPNRNTIFDRELCVVGIASAYHAKFERMVVACFAFDFVEGHDQATTPFQPTIDKFKHKELDIADLTESADGQHYVIAAGDLRVPKKQLRLYKQGQLLHLERTITNEDGSNPRHSSFKWEVPYQFNPNEVNAVINAKNEVTITLTKPDLSEGDQSVEVDVLSFSMEGTGPSSKMDVQAEESVDSINVHVVPSTYKENVVVKVLGLSMTFVAKHREIGHDDQGEYEKTVTSKRNITLPFPVSKRRFHITSTDNTGVYITIDKPHWTGDASAIIDIPIKDA